MTQALLVALFADFEVLESCFTHNKKSDFHALYRYNTFKFWRCHFKRFFESASDGHLRHRAIAARAQKSDLHNGIIGNIDELHVAAVGMQKRPKLIKGH
jgi:hypothetical protein